MKRLDHLSDAELIALKEEEITKLIEIECAFEGIEQIDEPGPAPVVDHSQLEKENFYQVGSLLFKDSKDAEVVLGLPAFKDEYFDYNLSSEYRVAGDADLEIRTVQLFKRDSIARFSERLKSQSKLISAWNERNKKFQEYQKKVSKIQETVLGKINGAKEVAAYLEKMKFRFTEYVKRANGDVNIAVAFFRNAYNNEEILTTILTERGFEYVAPVVEGAK